jgi:ferredoxin
VIQQEIFGPILPILPVRDLDQAIRFVNIRETAGWSAETRFATPKIAALLAAAALPDPDPVPSVSFASGGQVLIIGPAEAALHWAVALQGQLGVTVLATGRTWGVELPLERTFPVYSGAVTRMAGWLGAFEVSWSQDNPIDLDVCTRCNACVKACPEGAIDASFQIDLDHGFISTVCDELCYGQVLYDLFKRLQALEVLHAQEDRFNLVVTGDIEPVGLCSGPVEVLGETAGHVGAGHHLAAVQSKGGHGRIPPSYTQLH